jgi:hypothetical protein
MYTPFQSFPYHSCSVPASPVASSTFSIAGPPWGRRQRSSAGTAIPRQTQTGRRVIPCDAIAIAIPPSCRRANAAQMRRIRWSKRVGPGPSPLVPKTNKNKNASCRIDIFAAVVVAAENTSALVYCVFVLLSIAVEILSSLFSDSCHEFHADVKKRIRLKMME